MKRFIVLLALAAMVAIMLPASNVSGSTTVFFDDFNDGDYNGWTVTGGWWAVSGGVLQGTKPTWFDCPTIWTPVSVSNAAELTLEYDAYLRTSWSRNPYVSLLDSTGNTVAYIYVEYSMYNERRGIPHDECYRIEGNVLGTIAKYHWHSDNAWHKLKLETGGGKFSVYLDGAKIISDVAYSGAPLNVARMSIGGWEHEGGREWNPGAWAPVVVSYYDNFRIDYASPSPPFSFVHITDLHVAASESFGDEDFDGVVFGQVIDSICALSPKPAFVVATGDICHAGEWSNAQYPSVIQHLFPNTALANPPIGAYFADEAQTIPVYFVTGNHDYRVSNALPPEWNPENFPAQLGPLGDYVIDRGSAVIIGLNSGYDALSTRGDPMKPEGSGLTEAQLTWLHDQWVAAGSKKKIVFMHHPAVADTGTLWDGQINDNPPWDRTDGAIRWERPWFLAQCDSFAVDLVLTGHEHQFVDCDRTGADWTSGTRYIQTAEGYRGCYRTINVNSITVSAPQRFNILLNSVTFDRVIIDAGGVTPSPCTVYRDGYKVYYSDPITVDYAYDELVYKIGGLKLPYRYELQVIGYHREPTRGNHWNSQVKVDGQIAKVLKLKTGIPDTAKIDIPLVNYQDDGTIEVRVRRLTGDFASVDKILLYQYEPKEEPGKGGAQTASNNTEVRIQKTEFKLSLNVPNPLHQQTTISYQLASPANVSLKVYNINGQLIKTLASEFKPAGYHSVAWDGKDNAGKKVVAGVYLYRMDAGGYSETRKLTVLR